MREFIGHRLKVIADNFPTPVEGVMVDDKPNMILLKGSDGKITRVVKSHISGYQPLDFEPKDYVSFLVLCCENEKEACPGLQYIVEGEGFKRNDFEAFMGPCPCKVETCKFGSKGELRSVEGKFLSMMIRGAMFGEYPKRKEIKNASDNTKAGASKTGSSKASATGSAKAHGVSGGRSGVVEESADGQTEV